MLTRNDGKGKARNDGVGWERVWNDGVGIRLRPSRWDGSGAVMVI